MSNWTITCSNSGMVHTCKNERLARASFNLHCDHAARRSGETVTLWRDSVRAAEFSGTSLAARFLAHCLERSTLADAEFWTRLAGVVRKAGTL